MEYSLVKVIPKDLVNIFFEKQFKRFSIFKTPVYVFLDKYFISKV